MKPSHTPGKHPFTVPSQKLSDAIAAEWDSNPKYNPGKMPLTALAYTAIDRIAGQKEAIVEALMVYVDTETLSYRSGSSQSLAKRQKELWDPVIAWADKAFGATWQTTTGIMPVDQPEKLHQEVQKYLLSLDDMALAAACMLASCLSSLLLTLAILKKHITGEEAFRLSRLEEDAQAEQWGRDGEAEQRAARLRDDIVASERFLRLLVEG